MKYLKLNVVIVVLFTCSFGFSTVRICGNHTYPDGHTARVCHYFYAKDTKCDSADMLAIVSQPGGFTGGWTCQSDNFGIAATNDGDTKLVRTQDGKAFLTVKGETTQVASDAFAGFIETMQRETANMRANTRVIQSEIDTFLDSDSGFVSNERLRDLSLELGVPVVVTRGWNPKDEPGYHQSKWTGKTPAPSGSASRGSRRPDECSLPDCSCRVVNTSGDLLCKGGTEEETSAGVHYCKCGKFGAPSVQSVGAGGDFTVDDAGAVGRSGPSEDVMGSVAEPSAAAPSTTQPSRGQSTRSTRGPVASESSVGPPTDAQRIEGRDAAILLCRDVDMYGRSRQVATSPGARPPFSSVEPLCSLVQDPQRTKVYRCDSGGPYSHPVVGYCVNSWWESFFTGVSYCADLKHMCELLGGGWSVN